MRTTWLPVSLALACTLTTGCSLLDKMKNDSSSSSSPTSPSPCRRHGHVCGNLVVRLRLDARHRLRECQIHCHTRSTSSANVSFAATCGGSINVNGGGTGSISGSTLNWTANGLVSQGGVNCPFTLTNGTATKDPTGNVVVQYPGRSAAFRSAAARRSRDDWGLTPTARRPRRPQPSIDGRVKYAMSDLRDAFRALRATPIVSAVAILSLALGIGANTAIFSIVNTLMLRALPIKEPQQLVQLLAGAEADVVEQSALGTAAGARSASFLTALSPTAPSATTSPAAAQSENVNGILASGRFFDVLGVPAILGRTFTRGRRSAARGQGRPRRRDRATPSGSGTSAAPRTCSARRSCWTASPYGRSASRRPSSPGIDAGTDLRCRDSARPRAADARLGRKRDGPVARGGGCA